MRFDPARVGVAPNADADRAVASVGGTVADTYEVVAPGGRINAYRAVTGT